MPVEADEKSRGGSGKGVRGRVAGRSCGKSGGDGHHVVAGTRIRRLLAQATVRRVLPALRRGNLA